MPVRLNANAVLLFLGVLSDFPRNHSYQSPRSRQLPAMCDEDGA